MPKGVEGNFKSVADCRRHFEPIENKWLTYGVPPLPIMLGYFFPCRFTITRKAGNTRRGTRDA